MDEQLLNINILKRFKGDQEKSNRKFNNYSDVLIKGTPEISSHDQNTLVNRTPESISSFVNKFNTQFKQKDDFEEVIKELVRIHGINRSKAIELYYDGIRSIKDVINSDNVSERIRICAKYVNELEKRVPREHITEIIEMLQNKCKNISITGVGSYRRLKKTSGDIDILICVPEISKSKTIGKIIKSLPFYVYTTDEGEQSMRVIVKWKTGVYFMDIIYTIPIEFGAALMHTTGSMKFNIVMSIKAIKRGYKLSIHGLFYRETDERVDDTETEEKIFEKLGIKFIPPEFRENSADYKKYFIK